MNIDSSRSPISHTGASGRTGSTGHTGATGRTGGTGRFGDTARGTGKESRRRTLRRWRRRTRRRIETFVGRARRTVTPTGRFVVTAAVAAAILGAALGWIEAWFVAVVGAVLILAGLPFLLGSRAYLIAVVVERARVVAGGSVQVGIEIENASAKPALPARAELPVGPAIREIAIPFIGPQASVRLPVQVPTPVRGVIEVGPVTLARRDPLGLVQREITWRDRHLVHVHPMTQLLPPTSAGLVRDLEGAASRRLVDSDLSFHAVRDYVPGDARKHIHWRSTAKTGALMVRQYEESQTARTALLFDANRAEYASDDEFELAVSTAASLSLQAVREGRERFIASQWSPGRLRPSIDGLEELPSNTATQMLDSWAELGPAEDARPIERLARGLAESRRALSVVIVVTGSVPDTTRLRRAAVAFPPDVAVLAVRCEMLAEPGTKRLDVCTFLTVGALGDLPQLMLRGGAR